MTADSQLRFMPGSLAQVGNQDGGQGPAGSHSFGGKISCGLKYFWPGFVGLGCNFPVFSHNFVWVSVFLFFGFHGSS